MVTHRIDSLTSLRFLCALYVFLFHVHVRLPISDDPMIVSLLFNGAIGMAFFFILSGFVLTYAYAGRDLNYRVYLRNRVARIYPAYAMAVFLSFLIMDYGLTGWAAIGNVVANVFTLQGWFPFLFSHGLNGGTWSLSVEWLFYLLFPLLLPVFVRLTDRQIAILAGVAYALACVPGAVQYGLMRTDPGALYSFPVSRFPEFIVGMCAAMAYRRGWSRGLSPYWLPIIATGLLAFLCISFVARNWMMQSPITVPGIAAILFLAAQSRPRFLNWAPFVWLGEISYGFYLYQFIPLYLLAQNASRLAGYELLACAATFAATVALSAASYHLFEKPLMQAVRARKQRIAATSRLRPQSAAMQPTEINVPVVMIGATPE